MQGLAALRAAGVGSCIANTFFVRWKTAWHWRGGRELHIPAPGSRHAPLLEGEGQVLPSPPARRAASPAGACGGTGPGTGTASLPRAGLRGAVGLCRAPGRCWGGCEQGWLPARRLLQPAAPSRGQCPPGASPVLSRSTILARGVWLLLLTQQILLWSHEERFGGHKPFSINKRLRALPSAACRASSSPPRPPGSHRCRCERLQRVESWSGQTLSVSHVLVGIKLRGLA